MDVYKEQLVRKAFTTNDTIRKTAFIISAISISGIILVVAMMIAPQFLLMGIVAAIGIIYGAFYLMKDLEVEYEYLYTNGDFDIDKVIGQRKRKRLISINIHTVTEMGKYTNEVDIDESKTIVDASSGFEDEHWYIAFNHKSYGECYLIFTPNEDMLELIIDNIPKAVRLNVVR